MCEIYIHSIAYDLDEKTLRKPYYTPHNRAGKNTLFYFLEPHFVFAYMHQNDDDETTEQSNGLSRVDKLLKVFGLHKNRINGLWLKLKFRSGAYSFSMNILFLNY